MAAPVSKVTLLHSVHTSRLQQVLREGLKAASDFDDLDLEMRRGVVYCWLREEDDVMSRGDQRPDHVYLEVTVDEERCTVAEMDYASCAMMYRQGQKSHPKATEAAALLAELYQLTSVPLSAYQPGMFFSPEVLVKGDIEPGSIRVPPDQQ